MDRIAFRIFNPNTKQFEYSGSTPSMLESFFRNTATLLTVHKMEYEFFSGLQDQDKKDIYENDRVKAFGWNPAYYIIKFIEGGFCLTSDERIIPIDINMVYDSLGCHIMIIGNTHEGN